MEPIIAHIPTVAVERGATREGGGCPAGQCGVWWCMCDGGGGRSYWGETAYVNIVAHVHNCFKINLTTLVSPKVK